MPNVEDMHTATPKRVKNGREFMLILHVSCRVLSNVNPLSRHAAWCSKAWRRAKVWLDGRIDHGKLHRILASLVADASRAHTDSLTLSFEQTTAPNR